MGRKLTVDLWTDKLYKIKDMQEYLKSFKNDLEEQAVDIVREITYEGGYKAVEYNSMAPQSNPQRSTIRFGAKRLKGEIALEGPGAIYDEFGTGERGVDNPHPMKNDFSELNPYNSGPVVSTHINKNGRHYWFAPRWSSDPYMYSNGYTEGIPSGKQMYNTLKFIRDIKKDVTKAHINEAIKTVNR